MSDSNFYIGFFEDKLFVKLIGNISMKNVFPLKKFLKTISYTETRSILFDFSLAEYLDSTSIGIIASTGIKFKKLQEENVLAFINLSADLEENFLNFGFDQIAQFVDDKQIQFHDDELIPLSESEEKVSGEDILQAHKELLNMNEKNRQIFKNVVNLLEKDLHKGK